jgi:hypothetical protein
MEAGFFGYFQQFAVAQGVSTKVFRLINGVVRKERLERRRCAVVEKNAHLSANGSFKTAGSKV